MKHLIAWLLGAPPETPKPRGVFHLSDNERREVIKEIQLGTFAHLDKQDVCWVTGWALTLSDLSDDTILDIWEEVHGGR